MSKTEEELQGDSTVEIDAGMIAAVFAEPKAWTADGTFAEVMSFLNGYFTGLQSSPPSDKLQEITKWGHFRPWLCIRFASEADNLNPYNVLNWLFQNSPTEAEILERLKLLWIEFLADWERGWRVEEKIK